jgi:ribosomal protein L11 methyltransferase
MRAPTATERDSSIGSEPPSAETKPGTPPSGSDQLFRVAVRLALDEAEEARARLAELAPAGWEEVERGAELELAVYAGRSALGAFRAAFGSIEETAVEPRWLDRWREFHRPAHIGPLWIGPPWARAPTDAVAVVIDPGRAFGTGAHATTQLCLELLLELPRSSALDLGCGSGVLAIAAAKLGFTPVTAIDREQAAVDACRQNVDANGVGVAVRLGDVSVDALPEAELSLANLDRGGVEAVLRRAHGRFVIAAGYRARDRIEAGEWARIERRERDGWVTELFERSR